MPAKQAAAGASGAERGLMAAYRAQDGQYVPVSYTHLIKNTMAAPIVVIRKVNPVPAAAQSNACCIINLSLIHI